MKEAARFCCGLFIGMGIMSPEGDPQAVAYFIALLAWLAMCWADSLAKGKTTTLPPGTIFQMKAGEAHSWISDDDGQTWRRL